SARRSLRASVVMDSRRCTASANQGKKQLYRSEFVPQRELHDARLRQQAGVVAERFRQLLQRGDASASLCSQTGEGIEAMEVGHIEDFPTELQTLAFHRHLPALVQRH